MLAIVNEGGAAGMVGKATRVQIVQVWLVGWAQAFQCFCNVKGEAGEAGIMFCGI